jgi:predicted RNase H-like HicB family nuclease
MVFMATFSLPTKPIRCLLNFDPESGAWVAHCLDFDIVTSGRDDSEAWERIKSVVKLHIEHCFTHDQGGLRSHVAPQELIDSFDEGLKHWEVWSDKIKLNLIAPTKPENSFWIKGVELEQTTCLSHVH